LIPTREIGTLKHLRRYPVKSMAGEDLQQVLATFAGLIGDRVFAFIDQNNRSSFPWMTGRQASEMVLLKPHFSDPPDAGDEHPGEHHYKLQVTTPDGKQFDLSSPDFLQYLQSNYSRSLRLRFSERSMQDASPISLFGLQTINALSDEVGFPLDHRRFRANFYVDWANGEPFYEESLAGQQLQIGETLTITLVKKDERCVMISIDPDTARRSPEVLETVSRRHGGCAGMYGAVLREGVVRVGDPVTLFSGS
jgi:uncharacterized protein YcbX